MPDKKAAGLLDKLHIWLFSHLKTAWAASRIALSIGILLMIAGRQSGSAFLMILGAVLFFLSLFVDVVLGRFGRSSMANEKEEARKTVDTCKKLLSEINEQIYGTDEDGKEEISVTSPVLGKFIYRRKPEWYEAECDWCGSKIKVTFETDGKRAPEDYLSGVETLFEHRKKIDRAVRHMAADELDKLKTKAECPDELWAVDPKDFAKRLVPSNLHYAEYGDPELAELYYDDAPAYSDCSVIAVCDTVGSVSKVEISYTGVRSL